MDGWTDGRTDGRTDGLFLIVLKFLLHDRSASIVCFSKAPPSVVPDYLKPIR